MNAFFHAYTKKYNIRCRYATVLTAAPLAEICMMCVWAVLFNLRQAQSGSFLLPLAALCVLCCCAGLLLCWGYRAACDRAVRFNARYTYFDICAKSAVFSKFSGSYFGYGKRTVLRTLYVIPMKTFANAYLDEKKKHLILTGKIRVYSDESEKLGYHVVDGAVELDSWWYNEAGFTELGMLRLPMDFEHPAKIARALYETKIAFDKIPPKKPYVFREADIVKKRRELKRIAEENRYLRRW